MNGDFFERWEGEIGESGAEEEEDVTYTCTHLIVRYVYAKCSFEGRKLPHYSTLPGIL